MFNKLYKWELAYKAKKREKNKVLLYTEAYTEKLLLILKEHMPVVSNTAPPSCMNNFYFNHDKFLNMLQTADLDKIEKEKYQSGWCHQSEAYIYWIRKIAELNQALSIGDDYKVYTILETFIAHRILFKQEIYYNIIRLMAEDGIDYENTASKEINEFIDRGSAI